MKKNVFNDFLSKEGREIYDNLLEHCQKLGLEDADEYELSMLANSFDKYAKNAKYCRDNGDTQQPEKGGWDQVRPEYTVMKNEYQNILKHSSKFGMNPGDRKKIFNITGKDKKKKGFDLK